MRYTKIFEIYLVNKLVLYLIRISSLLIAVYATEIISIKKESFLNDKKENNGEFILIKSYHIKHINKIIFTLTKLDLLLKLTKNLTKDRFFFRRAPLLYGIAFSLLLCYSNIILTFSMTSLINLQEIFLLAAYIQKAWY